MLPTSLPMFYSSSVEMPRTSGLTPAMTSCPTMKILPKELASMQCGLPSLSTTEHLTKLPKDYEIFYERPRNQPTRNYDFKMRLYQLNKYLSLLTGLHGHHLDDDDMFHTIQECVPLEQFLHCLKHHDQKHQ
jgi:hypothetical protein